MPDAATGGAADELDPSDRVRVRTRERLLKATIHEVARKGPGGVSGRSVARRAHVHHSQVQQHFGSVEEMVLAAVRRACDEFLAEVIEPHTDATSDGLPDPLAVAERQVLWRAYLSIVLDPGPIELSEVASGGPLEAVAELFHQRHALFTKPQNTALAASWIVTPIGAMVFEEPFRRGLQLDQDSEWAAALEHLGSRLTGLATLDEFPAGNRRPVAPPVALDEPGQRTGTRDALVAAAVELLGTRLEPTIAGTEIADLAGVNHCMVTHHFGSRHALLDEAFDILHDRFVADAVPADDPSEDRAFALMRHETFFRTWAGRLISSQIVPDFELTAMRVLRERLADHRGIEPDDVAGMRRVKGDALTSMSLQLGWCLLSPLARAGGALDAAPIDDELRTINHWILAPG